jgi:methylase of polypeptide subunit release factors
MTMGEGVRQTEVATVLTDGASRGLGEMEIKHPRGTFSVTPAGLISLRAIGTHRQLLSGVGIDWGAGVGILAIAAARIEAVNNVYGLEIVPANVDAARENARRNGVAGKTKFLLADSFLPAQEQDIAALRALQGNVRFVLANPPSSTGDDGFEFRRRILRESRAYLTDGGVVFLSISRQYGRQRIAELTHGLDEFIHGGVLATTDCVPFDLNRPDLLDCLQAYVQEEKRGGWAYEFTLPGGGDEDSMTAQAAMGYYERSGQSPLSKWQTHLFTYHEKADKL